MIDYKAFVDSINRVNSCSITMVDPMFMKYAMGLADEGGEFIDMLKNSLYYGEKVDYDHVMEELGDVMYFVMLGCMHIAELWTKEYTDDAYTPERVLNMVVLKNVEKLKARFPHGFNAILARPENRDLEAEKKAMAAPSSQPDLEDLSRGARMKEEFRVHQVETEEVIDDG